MINGIISKKFDIALITDDNYVIPTMVTIKSIISSCSTDRFENIVFHICSFGLSNDAKNRLKSLEDEYFKIDIMEVDRLEYDSKMIGIHSKTHVTPVALLKFDLGELFPDIDELLYIDGDIIVKRDLCKIKNIDISEYYLAASFELWKYLKEKTLEDFYFNSGVMLLNLCKFRQYGLSDDLWETKRKTSTDQTKKYMMMDQDCLNIVCGKKCFPLDIIYNFNCHFVRNRYLKSINLCYNKKYKTIRNLIDDSVVIHYVGKHDKPWKYSNANLVEKWEKCYLLCGMSLSELNRERYRRSAKDYIQIIKNKIKR